MAGLLFRMLTESVGQSALAPMDAAVEYLRQRFWRVLPAYLVAMLPHAIAVMMVIDVVTSKHRVAIGQTCIWLTAATLWRWTWLGILQRQVMADVCGERPKSLWPRLAPLLMVRLLGAFCITWGSVLILPAYYGWFLHGFATPMMLETKQGWWQSLKTTLARIHRMGRTNFKIGCALSALSLLVMISVFFFQILMVQTVLPSLLGLELTEVSLTMRSLSWILGLFYFLFLVIDLYWTVLSVILYYSFQARTLGADLSMQLRELEAAQR